MKSLPAYIEIEYDVFEILTSIFYLTSNILFTLKIDALSFEAIPWLLHRRIRMFSSLKKPEEKKIVFDMGDPDDLAIKAARK